mgnify:CR=1 FL=1
MEDKRIKKYKKNNGDTAYMFNIYLGKNPLTGKDKRVTRRGFVSRREPRLAIARLESGMETGSYVKNPDIKVRTNLTFNLNYLI